MDEHQKHTPVVDEPLSFVARHRFFLLIGMTIAVALVLVGVSLEMYNLSGAAQLDFSRPGLIEVASESEKEDNPIKNYAGTGSVNRSTISEFQKLYDPQVESAKTLDAFGGDPLNPDVIEFSGTMTE